MKSSLIFFFLVIIYHFTYAQNNLFLTGKNAYFPLYGRFTYYPVGYNALFAPPTTNINYIKTFKNNKHWIEIGYLYDIFPNKHLVIEETSSLNPDTLSIDCHKYYLSVGKRLFSTKKENHSIYIGIGGIHRFKNTLTTVYASPFHEFNLESYSLLPSFGGRFNLSYLFLYKFIALKSTVGANFYPNYQDLQLEMGIQIGFYIFDSKIRSLIDKIKNPQF